MEATIKDRTAKDRIASFYADKRFGEFSFVRVRWVIFAAALVIWVAVALSPSAKPSSARLAASQVDMSQLDMSQQVTRQQIADWYKDPSLSHFLGR